jgi:hypothetical protein
LFSNSEEVEKCATEILRKLEMTVAGKKLLTTMNYFFMLKY